MALTKVTADLVTYTPEGGTETTVQDALVPAQGSFRIDFGNNGVFTYSSDPVVNVNRSVDDTGYNGNGHCFSDSSTITRNGGISYNSFDCRISVTGSENYGHFAPFQNGIVHSTSGTTSILYGYVDVPSITNGLVGSRYGIKINDVATSGTGSVNNNYAIWIDQQTASTANKWGIVQKGTSKNLFEGQVFFQSLINLHDTVIDKSASGGTRIAVGAGSQNDLSIMKADYSEYVWTVPRGTSQCKFWGGIVSKGKVDGSIYTLDSDQSAYGTGALGHIVFRNGNGIVGQIQTDGTATNYLTSSDYRLKTNVLPLENGVDKLKALKPVSFDWLSDSKRVDGFIAHEVQSVIPEAVSGQKDDSEYQGLDQSKIVPVLTKALQEALYKIEALEVRVIALEAV